MRKLLILGMCCWLSICLLGCGKMASHPRTPTAVVQALFTRISEYKDAQKTADEESSSEETAKKLEEARTAVEALFLNPTKAKLIMMPLLLLDMEDIAFLDEKIDGENAEVTIEHTVVGFGQHIKLQGSAQTRAKMTFQLKKEGGRWLISDTGGILQRFGR